MRPKLLHWCVIGWIDAPPQIALCTHVRRLEFLFPKNSPFKPYGGRSCTGVEELDSQLQVLQVLGAIRLPRLSESKFNETSRCKM
jgi:hypothetical protein